MTKFAFLAGAALAIVSTQAWAGILGGGQAKPSSGRNEQTAGQAQIPICTHRIGTLAIVEPDKQWWRELNLGSPEAIIKVFVAQSGCFTMVNRGGAMRSRAMERAMAEQGELQKGSNMGKGQVKAADYFLQPDIVTANQNSGGSGVGAGGFGGGGGLTATGSTSSQIAAWVEATYTATTVDGVTVYDLTQPSTSAAASSSAAGATTA